MLSEAKISKDIQEYLKFIGIEWIWRNQVYSGRVKSGAYLITGKAGISDLIFIAYGQTFYIEVKDAKGKQKPEQLAFEQHCKANNQMYLLARSVDDVKQLISDYT